MSSPAALPPPPATPESRQVSRFTCRFCGQKHLPVTLPARRKALCNQCGLVLAHGSTFTADATAALTVTGLILAVPAWFLPFVTVAKLGGVRVGHLLSGVHALARHDMGPLSVWVEFCLGLVPVLTLGALAVLMLPLRRAKVERWAPALERCVATLEEWAMPEVYVLAVLVALTKLGRLVDTEIGPGFWCYAAMSALLLLCGRNYHFEPGLFAGARSGRDSRP